MEGGQMIYYAAICPSCGHVQGGSSKVMYKAIFKCQKCNKSTRMYNSKGIKIRLLCTDTHPDFLKDFIKEYKKRNTK
jgi:hypothetical protein